jgi:hypothetical protein
MKILGLTILILVFFLAFVSPEIILEELNKDLQAGETFIGLINLDFKNDITKEDIKIFDGRRYLFSAQGIVRYGNLTFFYMTFPFPGNFSLILDKFLYFENSSLIEGSINKTIFIKNSTSSILTFSPGILYGPKPFIFIINSGSDSIQVELQGNKSELEPNSSKKIFLSSLKEFTYLDVSSYRNFKIPVIPDYSNIEKNISQIIPNESKIIENYSLLDSFKIISPKIQGNITVNKSFNFFVELVNNLNTSILLNLSSNLVKIEFNQTVLLGPYEHYNLNVSFLSKNTGIFVGNLSFYSNNISKELPISFIVLENYSIFNEFFEEKNSNLSCEDSGGEICLINQECTYPGSIRFINGFCCVGGLCNDLNSPSSSNKKNSFLGFFFIFLAGIIIYFSYKKFKGAKSISKI